MELAFPSWGKAEDGLGGFDGENDGESSSRRSIAEVVTLWLWTSAGLDEVDPDGWKPDGGLRDFSGFDDAKASDFMDGTSQRLYFGAWDDGVDDWIGFGVDWGLNRGFSWYVFCIEVAGLLYEEVSYPEPDL